MELSVCPWDCLSLGSRLRGAGWTREDHVCQAHDKSLFYEERMQIELLLLCTDPKLGWREQEEEGERKREFDVDAHDWCEIGVCTKNTTWFVTE